MDVEFRNISALLKSLRSEHKLTQVQLAGQVGLSPASIHRYEAGARPDVQSLLALAEFAEKVGSRAIGSSLRKVLASRLVVTGPDLPTGLVLDRSDQKNSVSSAVAKAVNELSVEEQIQILAYLEFLKGNTDTTLERIVNAALESWIEQIKERLGPDNQKRSSNTAEENG